MHHRKSGIHEKHSGVSDPPTMGSTKIQRENIDTTDNNSTAQLQMYALTHPKPVKPQMTAYQVEGSSGASFAVEV